MNRLRTWVQNVLAWLDQELDRMFYGDAWTKPSEEGKLKEGGSDRVLRSPTNQD